MMPIFFMEFHQDDLYPCYEVDQYKKISTMPIEEDNPNTTRIFLTYSSWGGNFLKIVLENINTTKINLYFCQHRPSDSRANFEQPASVFFSYAYGTYNVNVLTKSY